MKGKGQKSQQIKPSSTSGEAVACDKKTDGAPVAKPDFLKPEKLKR